MKIRIRSVRVERWPDRWRGRVALVLWIALLRLQYADRTTAWLLVCLVALVGLLLIGQAWR